LARLVNSSTDPMFKIAAIANLSSIDVDIRHNAMVLVDRKPLAIQDIIKELGSEARIFVAGQRVLPLFSKATFILSSDLPFFNFRIEDLKGLRHDLRIWGVHVFGSSYSEIFGSLRAPTNHNSAYGALREALVSAGYEITIDDPGDHVVGVYNGPEGGRGYLLSRDLVPGVEIKSYGFVMQLKRN
jgi:hypothetical protein